jgi:hypothetical protein
MIEQSELSVLEAVNIGTAPDPAHGVDVYLEPTRSTIFDLRLDLAATPSTYVDSDGFTVQRWAFDEPLPAGVDIRLRVNYSGQPVSLSRRLLTRAEVAATPPPRSEIERRQGIRDWFTRRRAELSNAHLRPEERDARLFFLELDRCTTPTLVEATLEEELAPGEIAGRRQAVTELMGKLLRRMRWRVRGERDLVEGTPLVHVEYVSDLLAPLFARHFAIDEGEPASPQRVLDQFARFAQGSFEYVGPSHSNGRPDGFYFFLFAEFALVAARCDARRTNFWGRLLGPLVMAQRVYVHAHGPPGKPFTRYGDRPTDRLSKAIADLLVTGWDYHDDPDGWSRQIDRNVWEASKGEW